MPHLQVPLRWRLGLHNELWVGTNIQSITGYTESKECSVEPWGSTPMSMSWVPNFLETFMFIWKVVIPTLRIVLTVFCTWHQDRSTNAQSGWPIWFLLLLIDAGASIISHSQWKISNNHDRLISKALKSFKPFLEWELPSCVFIYKMHPLHRLLKPKYK